MNALQPLLGGVLIGLSALILLLFNGKVLGISGILGGALRQSMESKRWRYLFLVGLLTGGFFMFQVHPETFDFSLPRSPLALIVAGFLVGYGTRLGSGCTSGHGVCGVSRFSIRSIVATFIFILVGAIVMFVISHVLGGRI